MTVIGASSRLFKWDAVQERFLYVAEDTRHLRIRERDKVISARCVATISMPILFPTNSDFYSSVIDRFLNIGMLLRRLEEFIKVLQIRSVN